MGDGVVDEFVDAARGHAECERVYRFGFLHVGKFIDGGDYVGVRHLQVVIEMLGAAADDALAAFREDLLDVIGVGVEEGEGDITGVVKALYFIGFFAVAGGGWGMVRPYGDDKGGDHPIGRFLQRAGKPPVQQACGQVEQQVAHGGRGIAA